MEETVPVQKIWLDTAETENDYAVPYEGVDEKILLEDMQRLWEMLLDAGENEGVARMRIGSMEPFNRHRDEIEKLCKPPN